MQRLRLPAPAKLNLFLHVTGRRDDGYHELQTVFQFIDLCDLLEFQLSEETCIVLEDGDCDVPPEENLVVRAAELLAEASGTRQGAASSG